MDQRERDALDRHITGNYGEDQLREESGMCIWDDCGNDAIYCEGHAREYMQPDIDAMRSRNAELVKALERINLRFYNFDNQHPSLCTNESARQLLADIEADIAGALSRVAAKDNR